MEEFATRFDATFDVRGHVLVAFDSPLDLLGTDRGRVLG